MAAPVMWPGPMKLNPMTWGMSGCHLKTSCALIWTHLFISNELAHADQGMPDLRSPYVHVVVQVQEVKSCPDLGISELRRSVKSCNRGLMAMGATVNERSFGRSSKFSDTLREVAGGKCDTPEKTRDCNKRFKLLEDSYACRENARVRRTIEAHPTSPRAPSLGGRASQCPFHQDLLQGGPELRPNSCRKSC